MSGTKGGRRESAVLHLEAAAAYIAVAESTDAKREAYAKAADEIMAAMDEDSTLNQAEIARQVGKGTSWVSDLLKWRRDPIRRDGQPFAAPDRQQRYVERKVPTRHEDRVEMIQTLAADPVVAKAVAKTIIDPKTKAGRLISQAVHEQDAEQRRKRAEQIRQRNEAIAMPLPAYMAKMVEQMNEWALGLAALVDDLDDLPEGRGREMVAGAAERLAEQAQRWVEKLQPAKPELRVIDAEYVAR